MTWVFFEVIVINLALLTNQNRTNKTPKCQVFYEELIFCTSVTVL